MSILITGAQGFVGSHLLNHLQSKKNKLVGLYHKKRPKADKGQHLQVQWKQCDLTQRKKTNRVIQQTYPNQVYHLAAQSSVPYSWTHPVETFAVNVLGTLHLMEALEKKPCRVLIVQTGEVYGRAKSSKGKIVETTPLHPENPYAASKVSQDLSLLPFLRISRLKIIRIRPFNHIGPGQSPRFVVSYFASQIAAIEAGKQRPILKVGNLKAKRDFTDVRDMVRAYEMVLQKGKGGEVYNVGSGNLISIETLLKKLLSLAKKPIQVQVDPKRYRPNDIPKLYSSSKKVRTAIGWRPQISIEQSLKETLDYWREQQSVR